MYVCRLCTTLSTAYVKTEELVKRKFRVEMLPTYIVRYICMYICMHVFMYVCHVCRVCATLPTAYVKTEKLLKRTFRFEMLPSHRVTLTKVDGSHTLVAVAPNTQGDQIGRILAY
jgi:hypothetical protein